MTFDSDLNTKVLRLRELEAARKEFLAFRFGVGVKGRARINGVAMSLDEEIKDLTIRIGLLAEVMKAS